jgi:predicted GNAT superfamily acetyltransferase
MLAVVQVQRAAWGMDDLTVIPPHLLTAVSKNGGIVLGAYADDRLEGRGVDSRLFR